MKKLNETKRVGVVLLTMCLLWLVACKRDQLQPLTPSILNTYRGTDKMVLQVIETLKEPVNKVLLAELEKQGSINWEYKALITSRFLEGITLRFVTGGNGDYLDAEINAETRMIKLYNKQQQEQRDAMAKRELNSKLNGNATLAQTCFFTVYFEYSISDPSAFGAATFFRFIFLDTLVRNIENAGFELVNINGKYVYKNANGASSKNLADMFLSAAKLYNTVMGRTILEIERLDVTNSCGDDGPPLTQTIPPITWRPASPVISYQAGDSYVDPLPFALSVTPFKDNGFWKLKIQSLTGSVSMRIFTGGYRDPDSDPPVTAGQANDAINYMSAYFSRGSAQGWHTTAATLAHENYHYTEIKAIGNHYWQQAAACINGIKVPASGNDAADKALAVNMADQVIAVFSNTCDAYFKTLGDGAGDRPYAAGQLELNKTITWIKQRADASGWWTTGGITIPNVDINNPTYQSFTPFYCPF